MGERAKIVGLKITEHMEQPPAKRRYNVSNPGARTHRDCVMEKRQHEHPLCQLSIDWMVLKGTYDPNSNLYQLKGVRDTVLRLIIVYWAWPEVMINSARLWKPCLFMKRLSAEMLAVNPHVTEAELWEHLTLNPDESIDRWVLKKLRALPELFGAVRATGDLILAYNQLSSLPDSFGSIEVGGKLLLQYNKLASLPESFGSLSVGRHLELHSNQLSSLPESFGSLSVGGDLGLDQNKLSSLPDSFGSIKVGGELHLDKNQLSSLPDSFGSIVVGADLHLDNNQLSSLPDSFGSISVTGNLYLNGNQLSSLPGSFVSINVGGRLQLQDNALQSEEIPESFPNVYGAVWTT